MASNDKPTREQAEDAVRTLLDQIHSAAPRSVRPALLRARARFGRERVGVEPADHRVSVGQALGRARELRVAPWLVLPHQPQQLLPGQRLARPPAQLQQQPQRGKPPLARRRIGRPSFSQVVRSTSSATREARPNTTKGQSLSQNRRIGAPPRSSNSSNNTSSSARFSAGKGRVRSSNRNVRMS